MQLLIDSIKSNHRGLKLESIFSPFEQSSRPLDYSYLKGRSSAEYWKAIKRGHTTINVTRIWSRPNHHITKSNLSKKSWTRSEFFWRCKMNQKVQFFSLSSSPSDWCLPFRSFYTLVTIQGKLNIKLRNFRSSRGQEKEEKGGWW